MWFKKNKALEVNAKNMGDLMNELNLLKARIRGIQDRAFEVKKGEAYYVVQTSTGRFSKVMLPYIGEGK